MKAGERGAQGQITTVELTLLDFESLGTHKEAVARTLGRTLSERWTNYRPPALIAPYHTQRWVWVPPDSLPSQSQPPQGFVGLVSYV